MKPPRNGPLSPAQIAVLTLLTSLLAPLAPPVAAAVRVLPEGEVPEDSRLAPPKDLNGFFPFRPPATETGWEMRSERVRRRIQVAAGLLPFPERTPLNAVLHGPVEREGFTVEKVYFESVPGHFVTGLLFRPSAGDGPFPGVLSPHGHGGRWQDHGEDGIRREIASGAERFERSGRFPKIARCAQLARMGCVTFLYDMLGYADSVQIPMEVAHRFARQRPELDAPDRWGFFGVQAELRLQSILGLQTWNSLRALDFLASLPEVDPERLAVTGGSGGGTQTLLVAALDPRPVVTFPQGMVSTSMQGGCTCENASLLRIGTGNVEFAALFAPKPQAMTAANDWTRDMMTEGFPQLRALYSLLGAPDAVACRAMLHFPHNYNAVTRVMMYSWLNRHLGLGLQEPILEEDFEPLTPGEGAVWNGRHPAPDGGVDHETTLTRQLAQASEIALARAVQSTSPATPAFQEFAGPAIEVLIGRPIPSRSEVERTTVRRSETPRWITFHEVIRNTTHDEALPVVAWYPTSPEWNREAVLWITPTGKDGLTQRDGRPDADLRALLDSGFAVVTADLFLQGEFLSTDAKPENRLVDNPREFAGYTFGYNDSLFARRVHDILTLLAVIQTDERRPDRLHLLGEGAAGPWTAAARALSGTEVDRLVADTDGFRFTSVPSFRHPQFLPGAVKYGDVPGLLALSAPNPLVIAGEGGAVPELTASVYQGMEARDAVDAPHGTFRQVVRNLFQPNSPSRVR